MPAKATWPNLEHDKHHDLKVHSIMLKLNIQSTVMMIEEDQKPPIETVMAALRAAATYIERSDQEPRIQTVLEEVRKLASDTSKRDTEIKEKITHIKHQSRSSVPPRPTPACWGVPQLRPPHQSPPHLACRCLCMARHHTIR